HARERQVRHDAGEDLAMSHLTRHYGLGHAGLLERRDAAPQLAERHPVCLVDLAFQLRRRCLANRDAHQLASGTARGARDQEGKLSVASDQTEWVHSSSSTPRRRRFEITPRLADLMNSTRK